MKDVSRLAARGVGVLAAWIVAVVRWRLIVVSVKQPDKLAQQLGDVAGS